MRLPAQTNINKKKQPYQTDIETQSLKHPQILNKRKIQRIFQNKWKHSKNLMQMLIHNNLTSHWKLLWIQTNLPLTWKKVLNKQHTKLPEEVFDHRKQSPKFLRTRIIFQNSNFNRDICHPRNKKNCPKLQSIIMIMSHSDSKI